MKVSTWEAAIAAARADSIRATLDTTTEVIAVLERILGLQGRTRDFTSETRLLGAIPELDSMAVASVLTSLEDRYGFTIDDDEIDGSAFATVGSLAHFVNSKLSR